MKDVISILGSSRTSRRNAGPPPQAQYSLPPPMPTPTPPQKVSKIEPTSNFSNSTTYEKRSCLFQDRLVYSWLCIGRFLYLILHSIFLIAPSVLSVLLILGGIVNGHLCLI